MPFPEADDVTSLALASDWPGVAAQFGAFAGGGDPGLDGRMTSTLDEALRRSDRSVKALYFGYDPLNRGTAVYLCESYGPDEDWAADFATWVDGPAAPAVDFEEEVLEAAGTLFASFGRAVDELRARVRVPVAFGVNDADVYDAVRPPRRRPPTRSKIPHRLDPHAYYRLGPFDPSDRAGNLTLDGQAQVELEGAMRAFERGAVGAERDLREQLERHADGLAIDRAPEHVEKTGLFGRHFLSRPLANVLSERTDPTSSVDVTLTGPDGAPHPYAVWRPERRVADVELDSDVRVGLARGRVMPAFRRSALAGAHVFTDQVRKGGVESFCYVSGDVLQEVVRRGCVSGLAAAPIIVLEPGEAEQPGNSR